MPQIQTRTLAPKAGAADWFGSMKDTPEIVGDIVSPVTDEQEWDAFQDQGCSRLPLMHRLRRP